MKKILFLVILFYCLPLNHVFAHTHLIQSSPSQNETIKQAIHEVVLTFDNEIETGSTFTIRTVKGETILPENINLGPKQLKGSLPPLQNGDYAVEWDIIGRDGHRITGEVLFTIDVPAAVQEPEKLNKEMAQEATPEKKKREVLESAEKPQSQNEPGGIMVPISEGLFFSCYSLLMGIVFLNLIPKRGAPVVLFPRWLRVALIFGLILFSFPPIMELIIFLKGDRGIIKSFKMVIENYEVGRLWAMMAGVCLLLLAINLVPTLEKRRALVFLSFIFLVVIAFVNSLSSHAGAHSGTLGATVDLVHFLAVTIWTGTLIVVSWFTVGETDWDWVPLFLKWFTPLALTCLLVTVFSGITMTQLLVGIKNIPQAMDLPYGQALLIKHLLIVPLLIVAGINGVFSRMQQKRGNHFNIRFWFRLESVFVILIYFVTAFLVHSAPPA